MLKNDFEFVEFEVELMGIGRLHWHLALQEIILDLQIHLFLIRRKKHVANISKAG